MHNGFTGLQVKGPCKVISLNFTKCELQRQVGHIKKQINRVKMLSNSTTFSLILAHFPLPLRNNKRQNEMYIFLNPPVTIERQKNGFENCSN